MTTEDTGEGTMAIDIICMDCGTSTTYYKKPRYEEVEVCDKCGCRDYEVGGGNFNECTRCIEWRWDTVKNGECTPCTKITAEEQPNELLFPTTGR